MPPRVSSLFHGLIRLRFIPAAWLIPCCAVLGVLAGLGLAVGRVSRATSYLSDDPEACVNCHVMRPQYASWRHSSHSRVATCNDCHVPHETVFHTYAFKARDGLYHAGVFTLRWEAQVIRISSAAIPVVENNCRRCHRQTIEEVSARTHRDADKRCWDCHRELPHGRVRSLSSAAGALSPELPSVLGPQGPQIGGRQPRPPGGKNP